MSASAFLPTYENVKPLGRTMPTEKGLWLAYSASGAEFSFCGTRLSVTVIGDDEISEKVKEQLPRFAVFIDGERVLNKLLSEPSESLTVFESEASESHTVRIVKLSETEDSTIVIGQIDIENCGFISPTERKKPFIEFIGDSITCGYGVDAASENESFSTGTEDATKGYAYLTAELLGADYSLVSKSGHGIISGYSGDGTIQSWGIMPEYYELFGSGSGAVDGVLPGSIKWDFSKISPDVIVINLGTNDYSYTGSNQERQATYKTAYVDLIRRVRELNPNAYIVCALGIMGAELYPMVKEAVEMYSQENSDERITSFKFTVQTPADGYGADWHPSKATQEKAARELEKFIKSCLVI